MLNTSRLFQPSIPVSNQVSIMPLQLNQVAPVPQFVPQPILQTVVKPVVQPVVQPVIQPIVTPMVMTPPAKPQILPQTVIPTPLQRNLSLSPDYGQFIPPTPIPQGLPYDAPPKIYQFYQQVPNLSASVQAVPAFSTISTPTQSLNLSMGVPQYQTLSLI